MGEKLDPNTPEGGRQLERTAFKALLRYLQKRCHRGVLGSETHPFNEDVDHIAALLNACAESLKKGELHAWPDRFGFKVGEDVQLISVGVDGTIVRSATPIQLPRDPMEFMNRLKLYLDGEKIISPAVDKKSELPPSHVRSAWALRTMGSEASPSLFSKDIVDRAVKIARTSHRYRWELEELAKDIRNGLSQKTNLRALVATEEMKTAILTRSLTDSSLFSLRRYQTWIKEWITLGFDQSSILQDSRFRDKVFKDLLNGIDSASPQGFVSELEDWRRYGVDVTQNKNFASAVVERAKRHLLEIRSHDRYFDREFVEHWRQALQKLGIIFNVTV